MRFTATNLFFISCASAKFVSNFTKGQAEDSIDLGGNPTANTRPTKRFVELPLQRHDSIPGLRKRAINPATATLEITDDGAGYTASIEIGTPPQTLNLILDTGSPLTWLSSTNVSSYTPSGESAGESTSAVEKDICTANGCFSSSASSTFKTSPAQVFAIEYVDGSEAIGEITTDTVDFAGLSVAGFQFGLVTYQYSPDDSAPAGIIGLSPPAGLIGYPSLADAIGTEANTTEIQFNGPTLLDQFVSANVIDTDAFSLYLNNEGNGSVLLGGVDFAKISGPLTVVPIADTSEDALQVIVTGVAFNGSSVSSSSSSSVSLSSVVATLDSGTTEIYLPESVVELIATELGGTVSSGQPLVKCSSLTESTTIDFHFENSAVVRTPVELLVDLEDKVSGVEMCRIGIISTSSDGYYLLGDYFLRSAYVVYNWQESEIALAQVAYSTNTNISSINAGAYGIPGAIYNSSSPGATSTASVATISSVDSTVSAASSTATNSSAKSIHSNSAHSVSLLVFIALVAFSILLI